MGKEEQASPRTARPSLRLRMKVMSSGLSLVQETADSIDEVMRSQGLMGERSTFRSIIFHLICSASSFPTLIILHRNTLFGNSRGEKCEKR
jgi:hypothetical protein